MPWDDEHTEEVDFDLVASLCLSSNSRQFLPKVQNACQCYENLHALHRVGVSATIPIEYINAPMSLRLSRPLIRGIEDSTERSHKFCRYPVEFKGLLRPESGSRHRIKQH